MPETKDPKTAGARSYQRKAFDEPALKGFAEPVRLYALRWRP